MRDRDDWLYTTVIELADTGQEEFSETVYLGDFTDRLAELLAPAQICVLLPTDSGGTAVGSDQTAGFLAQLEADGATGPGTSCYRAGLAIRQLPLAAARSRWPEFTAAAECAGLAACSTLPLRHAREAIGAVSVLTAHGQLIAAPDLRLAQTLAELATIVVLRQRELRQSRRLALQLQHALDSRVAIEQAKGAVSARLDISVEDAFKLLRSYARARSVPLPRVAADVVSGSTPARALIAGGSRPRQSGQHGSGQRHSACRALCWDCAGFAGHS